MRGELTMPLLFLHQEQHFYGGWHPIWHAYVFREIQPWEKTPMRLGSDWPTQTPSHGPANAPTALAEIRQEGKGSFGISKAVLAIFPA
ncbi:hypothetical protein VUR80DRAFT_9388 [Thermomyces stellatus]